MTLARSLRVLVVDDQMSMRALMRSYLRKLGFESIDEADSGKNAFLELGKRPYNLVVSDFNMENGTGLELLVNMRKHPVLKRVPVIMVTGNNDQASVTSVVQAGVNGYVVKPVSQDALKARIVKIFGPIE
ncbi:MAG: response regulator [Tagaea sp.]|nr:response regulator [Azospirillum sp.]MCA3266716.1 response regulator [Azospirillum sp.]MCZ8124019.1 response regulator [Magnetospirillum sp.]